MNDYNSRIYGIIVEIDGISQNNNLLIKLHNEYPNIFQ